LVQPGASAQTSAQTDKRMDREYANMISLLSTQSFPRNRV
jgi:hypothetical protein